MGNLFAKVDGIENDKFELARFYLGFKSGFMVENSRTRANKIIDLMYSNNIMDYEFIYFFKNYNDYFELPEPKLVFQTFYPNIKYLDEVGNLVRLDLCSDFNLAFALINFEKIILVPENYILEVSDLMAFYYFYLFYTEMTKLNELESTVKDLVKKDAELLKKANANIESLRKIVADMKADTKSEMAIYILKNTTVKYCYDELYRIKLIEMSSVVEQAPQNLLSSF